MDPSQMTDEELDAAIAGQPEETVINEEPAAPPQEGKPPVEKPEEEPEPGEQPAEPVEEEPKEAPQPSRREQLRVQDLLKKYGSPQPAPSKPQAPAVKEPDMPNFRELIDGPEEVYQTLENAWKQSNPAPQAPENAYDPVAVNNTTKWEIFLNMDAPQMETKYPVLDKGSEEFHPALSDALSRSYLQQVGYDPETGLVANPNLRWKDFVESQFELAEEIALTRTQATAASLAKQAAATGLRPDGSSAKRMNLNQAPESMTDEELDAVIAQSLQPRDSQGRFK